MPASTATPVKDLLIAGRSKIADEKHWTIDEAARDAAGNPVDPGSPEAVCWCAYGALKGAPDELIRAAFEVLSVAARELFENWPAAVNDEFGHRAVMKMYGRAIELSEAA